MTQRPHSSLLGTLIAIQVVAWSFNYVAGKFGLTQLGPFTLASFRLVLAGLLFLLVFLISRPRVKIRRRDLEAFALLGLLVAGINQACFTIGLDFTTVGHSAIIVAMGPIFVLLLACAQKLEHLTRGKIVGMGLSFAGVVVLATEYGIHLHSGTWLGDLITLTGTTAFAFYAVLGKKVAHQYDTVTMNTFSHVAGAILWLPVAIHQALRLHWGQVGWRGWAGLLYMAGFGSVTAYLIFFWALRYLAASRLSTFTYLQPVFATILGVLILGERITSKFLVGAALVLVGVYLAERGRTEAPTGAN